MPLLQTLTSSFGVADTAQEYFIVPSAATVNEGSTITFNVYTNGVPDNTTLYYSTGGTITSDDTSTSLTGTLTVTNNVANVSFSFTNDLVTEGTETISLILRAFNSSGPVVTQSEFVSVMDTSTLPYGSVVARGATTASGNANTGSSYLWTVPEGVTSISVVCIGVGAPGSYMDPYLVGSGGGGGALSYVNNKSVTPGTTYELYLGRSPQGGSYGQGGYTIMRVLGSGGAFMCGAQGGLQNYMGAPGTKTGTSNTTPAYRLTSNTSYTTGTAYNVNSHGGGPGGLGGSGSQNATTYKGGGGGAGGYGAAGGSGGTNGGAGGSGTSGAGGGGGCGTSTGGPGGGSNLYGTTSTNSGGTAGSAGAVGGGGTASGATGTGSAYGGGGGSGASISTWSNTFAQGLGGRSAIRIVWPGITRQFPSTDVASTTNETIIV